VHVGSVGNEAADSEAKTGATSSNACPHARTTKTWMLSRTRLQLRERWITDLPDAVPSFRLPDHLRRMRWPDSHARYGACMQGANHKRDLEPFDCGKAFVLSTHILLECRLFHRSRLGMVQKALDLTISSILRPAHGLAVL
jgi:hypothetical protein